MRRYLVLSLNMGREDERIAETEALFRDVNEQIAETAERFDVSAVDFYCECSDVGCHDRLEVPLEDYEEVRSESTHFIVSPGHEDERVERVLAQRGRFAVIDKVHHVVAAIVTRLDPRTDEA
jgi:hypothetical protein